MTSLKLAEWQPGTLCCKLLISAELQRQLEVEILEKLKVNLPKGTFFVSADLNVEYNVGGTADQLAKAAMQFETHVFHRTIEQKEKK